MKILKLLFFIPLYLFQIAVLVVCFFPGFLVFMEDSKGRKGADPMDMGAYFHYYFESELFKALIELDIIIKSFIAILGWLNIYLWVA